MRVRHYQKIVMVFAIGSGNGLRSRGCGAVALRLGAGGSGGAEVGFIRAISTQISSSLRSTTSSSSSSKLFFSSTSILQIGRPSASSRRSIIPPLAATAANASPGKKKKAGSSSTAKALSTPATRRKIVPKKAAKDDDEVEELDEEEEDEIEFLRQSAAAIDWDKVIMQMEDMAEEEGPKEEEVAEYDEADDEVEEVDGQGSIQIRNSQKTIPIEMDLLHRQMESIMEIINCSYHDVSLWLTNDRSIREYNDKYRGKRQATDILSFPFHEYDKPEIPTKESLRLNGRVKDLGDMMVSLAYVKRQCERDEADLASLGENQWTDERGASGAMSKIFDVQGRLPYLVIHGVLHLLGYDHETDKDYQLMVEQEERVIEEFEKLYPALKAAKSSSTQKKNK